jgi:hypothetical protein
MLSSATFMLHSLLPTFVREMDDGVQAPMLDVLWLHKNLLADYGS